MLTPTVTAKRIVMVRMSTGDDLLERLKEAVAREKIANAIIVMGFGSVSSYHYHVVSSRDTPPAESYPQGDYALDILNVNGMIIDGRVHAHITFSDNRIALGGHLEKGCIAHTFTVIALQEVEEGGFSEWDAMKPL